MWALLYSDGTVTIVCLATQPFVSKGRFDCYSWAEQRTCNFAAREDERRGGNVCLCVWFPPGYESIVSGGVDLLPMDRKIHFTMN